MEFTPFDSALCPLQDEKGRYYDVTGEGFVKFGDVSRNLLGRQAQYGCRYLGGFEEDYPNLGQGLRISGDPFDYHGVGMHPEDVEEFLNRYNAYQVLRTGMVVDKGEPREVTDAEELVIKVYLAAVGVDPNFLDA